VKAGQGRELEQVRLCRNGGLVGVEARLVGDSARAFCYYSTGFEFLAPESWSGEVRHRGVTAPLEPGAVLCARPGEVFAAQSVRQPGSRASLLIEERSFGEYLDEHGVRASELELVPQAPMSPALHAGLASVFRSFQAECSALEIQTALVEFFALAVPELCGRGALTQSSARGEPRAARRIRERLEQDQSETVDLAALAREVGLSRFATLRAFKRHYGLPPHAYRLSMRLGLARRALRRGLKPAEVAVLYGFVDQSHLTRHFKQRFGVTPAEYVRAGAPREAQRGTVLQRSSGPASVLLP
jgi:AraC-like DNA-binding protein